MTRPCGLRAVLLAVLATAAASPSLANASAAPGSLDALVKRLNENAARWLEDQPIDVSVEKDLKNLTFDMQNVEALNSFLRSADREAQGLYVVARLFRQLQMAKTEVIQAALAGVKAYHGRVRRTYKPIPQYSKSQLEAFVMPDYRAGASSEAIMKQMAIVQQRRDAKIARERPLAKYDEALWDVELRGYVLMLQAQSAKEDQAVLQALLLGEKQDSAMFVELLNAIGAEAKNMSKERARALYDELQPVGLKVRMMGKQSYTDQGKVSLDPGGNSSFGKTQILPGIEILTVVNRLANPAMMPAQKIPTSKEIEAFNKKKSGK